MELLGGEKLLKDGIPAVFLLGGPVNGKLFLSSYRLVFKLEQPLRVGPTSVEKIRVLLGSVFSVSQSSSSVEIRSKPANRFTFKFESSKVAKDIASWVKDSTPPNVSFKKSFLSQYKPSHELSGLRFGEYFPFVEFARFGIEDGVKWKLGPAADGLCETYPEIYFVPRSATDEFMKIAISSREQGAVPLLLYSHDEAQLYTSLRYKESHAAKCADKLGLLEVTFKAKNPHLKKSDWWLVLDISRPKLPKMEGQDYRYATIPSATSIVNDWKILTQFLETRTGYDQVVSGWMTTVNTIGVTAQKVANWVKVKKKSVCIQGSQVHKSVAHTLIASVAQVIMDHHYRTIVGLCMLIDKDWVSLCYPFYSTSGMGKENGNRLWELFLNCLYCLVIQFPSYFEYNIKALEWLYDESTSCRFATFCREKVDKKRAMNHAWDYFLCDPEDLFFNPMFISTDRGMLTWKDTGHSPICHFWDNMLTREDLVHELVTSRFTEGQNAADLSKLNLIGFPPIQAFRNSECINLSFNFIAHLSIDFFVPSLATTLDLSNNPLCSLYPDFMKDLAGVMPRLKNLIINGVKMEFPERFGAISSVTWDSAGVQWPVMGSLNAKHYMKLKELRMRSSAFTSLPPILSVLKSLEVLDLCNNEIPSISGIHTSMNLTTIKMRNNKLRTLPDEIYSMPNLTYLDVSQNRLTKISKFTRKLVSLLIAENTKELGMWITSNPRCLPLDLQELDVSGLGFSSFPEELQRLTNLTSLSLSKNRMKQLPTLISDFALLKKLNVSENKLTEIPASLGFLKLLEELDISSNNLDELPVSLGLLKNLHGDNFKWAGNKKVEENLTPEMKTMASTDVALFMKTQLTERIPYYRVKLLLVGEENMGKTSMVLNLVSQWKTEKAQLEESQLSGQQITGDTISTDGIDITNSEFIYNTPLSKKSKFPDRPKVNVSFWDFAGQELYYVTHQFFLSEGSIFIIVFDLRKPLEQSRVEFWLYSISLKVENPQIYIVGTRLDQVEKDKLPAILDNLENNRRKYMALFPSAKIRIGNVSCTTGEGIKEFCEKLEDFIMQQPIMGKYFPRSIPLLEHLISENKKKHMPPILSKSEFYHYGRMCCLNEEEELLEASQVLHDFGVIIYFPTDPQLCEIVLLDPYWLTELIASLITTKHKFIRDGLINNSSLLQLWRPPKYPQDLHFHLYQLLKRFEIVYNIPDVLAHILEERRKLPASPAPVQEIKESSVEPLLAALNSKANPDTLHEMILSMTCTELNHFGVSGVTPLFCACQLGLTDAVVSLLGVAGIDTNKGDRETGRTPLHAAAVQGHPLIIAFLMWAGATVNTLSNDNKLAESEATSEDAQNVFKLYETEGVAGISMAFPQVKKIDHRNVLSRSTSSSPRSPRSTTELRSTTRSTPRVMSISKPGGTPRAGIRATPRSAVRVFSSPRAPVSSGISKKMADDMKSYLSSFSIAENIANAGAKNTIDYTGNSLVPCMLPAVRPSNMTLWEPFPLPHEYQLERIIQFGFVPNGLMSRLIVRTLTLYPLTEDMSPYFWADGLQLDCPYYNLSITKEQNEIILKVRGLERTWVERLFCSVVEAINNLLAKWKQLKVEMMSPCSECAKNKRTTPTVFQLQEIEQLFMNKKSTATCSQCEGEVEIKDIAPDMQMTYLKGRQVPYSEFKMDKELGVGGFAIVYLGEFEEKKVAIKVLKSLDAGNEEGMSHAFYEFRKEIFVMSNFDCPYLIGLLAISIDPLAMVLELCPHGDLFDFLHKKPEIEFGWDLRIKMALDISRGMSYMHSQTPPVMHLDLKTPNILVSSMDYKDEVCVKVTDFGLSSTGEIQYTRLVDNPVWLAPEILIGLPYTFSNEVYAFGVILYEILDREEFFGECSFLSELAEWVMDGKRPPIRDGGIPAYVKLLTDCWAQQPEDRPTFPLVVKELERIDMSLHHLVHYAKCIAFYEEAMKLQAPFVSHTEPLNAEVFAAKKLQYLNPSHWFTKKELEEISQLVSEKAQNFGALLAKNISSSAVPKPQTTPVGVLSSPTRRPITEKPKITDEVQESDIEVALRVFGLTTTMADVRKRRSADDVQTLSKAIAAQFRVLQILHSKLVDPVFLEVYEEPKIVEVCEAPKEVPVSLVESSLSDLIVQEKRRKRRSIHSENLTKALRPGRLADVDLPSLSKKEDVDDCISALLESEADTSLQMNAKTHVQTLRSRTASLPPGVLQNRGIVKPVSDAKARGECASDGNNAPSYEIPSFQGGEAKRKSMPQQRSKSSKLPKLTAEVTSGGERLTISNEGESAEKPVRTRRSRQSEQYTASQIQKAFDQESEKKGETNDRIRITQKKSSERIERSRSKSTRVTTDKLKSSDNEHSDSLVRMKSHGTASPQKATKQSAKPPSIFRSSTPPAPSQVVRPPKAAISPRRAMSSGSLSPKSLVQQLEKEKDKTTISYSDAVQLVDDMKGLLRSLLMCTTLLHQTKFITPDFSLRLREALATTKQLQEKAKIIKAIDSRNVMHNGFQEEFVRDIAGLVAAVIQFVTYAQKNRDRDGSPK
eukprot:TRINITY_DN231_c0_g1_i2.p1 TRINITY_DN231_c0_g1~~TRINITY_DN231_c0_g1_i2.p1  ORF type:complete len:2533 (-),score=509.78 TRINITY_DN231_c0_g1_i2:1516-9114(-)